MVGTPLAKRVPFPHPESAHKLPGKTPPQHRARKTAAAPALPKEIEKSDLKHTQVQIITNTTNKQLEHLALNMSPESLLIIYRPPKQGTVISSTFQSPFVAVHYRPAAAYLGLCSTGHQKEIQEARHLHPETGLACAPRPRSF